MRGMVIDESKLCDLWLENDNGDTWTYYETDEPPEGFIYQHSKFPTVLHHSILRAVLPDEVEKCNHPLEHIKKTYGWIEGIEGRRCSLCQGTQVKPVEEEWPENWDASGCVKLMEGSSSYPANLVLSMARPSLKDRVIAIFRGYFRLKKYPLPVAIRIAADTCERCLNVLLYKYGQGNGYKEFSDEWHRCNTTCQFCEHLGVGKHVKKQGASCG